MRWPPSRFDGDSLKKGLEALSIEPSVELPNERMIEVIDRAVATHFVDIDFECPTCGSDLPELSFCLYCGESFDGLEEEPKEESRRYRNHVKVDGRKLLQKLIQFFEVEEVRESKTVIAFRDCEIGVLFKVYLLRYSLKLEFPFRAERITNHKALGIKNYKTPRAGYPCRMHIRDASQIAPDLIEALSSVRVARAQEKVVAPKFRNRLERAALRQALKKE